MPVKARMTFDNLRQDIRLAVRGLLRAPAFEWTARCADDWRQPWPGFAGTRYEAKALREGRVPCYFTFRRQ